MTGPWMHNGAYTTLRAAVIHHLDYEDGLRSYRAEQLEPEFRREVHSSAEVIDDVAATITTADGGPTRRLSDTEIDDLLAFLDALTSPAIAQLPELTRDDVPSGLPLPDVDAPAALP